MDAAPLTLHLVFINVTSCGGRRWHGPGRLGRARGSAQLARLTHGSTGGGAGRDRSLGAPPCLHDAHVGFAASPLHPAQLPAYLPEPGGEEDGSKQTRTRAWRRQGRGRGGGSRVFRGWQPGPPSVPLRSTDWQRGFRVPPGCQQLRSGAPPVSMPIPRAPAHPTVQPWGAMLLRARFECALTRTCTGFQSIPRPAWPPPTRAASLCHPPG